MSPLKKIKVKSIKSSQRIKPVTLKDWFRLVFFPLILFFGGCAGILFGGSAISRHIKESIRKAVDKNGAVVKAVIYKKSAHKGRSVFFKYSYKGVQYKESEGSVDQYDNLDNGDSIYIKIDTLDPENVYVVGY